MSISSRPDPVNPSRGYNAAERRHRAAELHARTLEAARSRFLAAGYVATTIDSIARASGVSAATIYKSYGGKSGLVRTLCRQALAGEGPQPAEERSNALRGSGSAAETIAGWGRLVAEVSPRVSPLLLVLRDAASRDVEAAALYGEFNMARLSRMSENARYLAQSGSLRRGVAEHEVRDILWLASSPELFELLVQQRQWSIERYSSFVGDIMAGTLL